MSNLSKVIFSMVLLLSANMSMANKSDVKKLVSGCVTLTKIYETRSEKSLLASQMTSVSDSFSAGYCMGVVKTYGEICRKYNWFQIATFIAAQSQVVDRYRNTDKLVEVACGN